MAKSPAEYRRTFRRKMEGILSDSYHKHIYRSKIRGWNKPSYDLNILKSIFLKDEKFLLLYRNWVDSGYKKDYKPSIDRIDHKQPYLLSNIQIMTYLENRKKSYIEFKNSYRHVIRIDSNGKEVEYISQADACRLNQIGQGNLSKLLKGSNLKTLGGFKWKYKQ